MRRASASRLTPRLEQRPHADGVTAEQVFLQGQHFVRLDALVGELAEAGVDAVDRVAAFEEIDDAAAGLLDALAGGRGQAEALDAAVQDGSASARVRSSPVSARTEELWMARVIRP